MAELAAWLERIGLGKYADAFAEAAIDLDVLPDLSEADLEGLGLKLGDRKRLLKAIAAREDGNDVEAAGAEHRPLPSAAERRQLTVMFVDLVGSTGLSRRLDPEDLGTVMRAYQRRTTEVVQRWGGNVAKYLGDGVLAYFGWPEAHEDDAERAVRAGLGLTQAIGELDDGAGEKLAVRVGIATGPVVVGELTGKGAAQEQAVVGETPNLAARLQALAAPGTVVVAASTRRLVGGLFELGDLGPLRLKGFAEPLTAWRVEREAEMESRFEATRGRGLTALVGRDHELGLLLDRWARAKDGDGQVVLLSGEAGIGKSRLIRALRERIAGDPHVALPHYGSAHHTSSAFHPVVQHLERAAGFARDDPPDVRRDKLAALLGPSSDDLGAAMALIAPLVGLEPVQPLDLTPERRKQLTIEALAGQVEGLSRKQPVLAIYEDVHWFDPSSLEAVERLIERAPDLRVLVVIACRPDFLPPWAGRGEVAQLSLTRLARRDGAAMLALISRNRLPPEIEAELLARADGVPLFVEELTKAVLESGLLQEAGDGYTLSAPLPKLAIPASLQDSLMARLDRLAAVKDVAQIAAVIGRDFTHGLLAKMADRSDEELAAALGQLEAADLIRRREHVAEATYSFKHALVQDAAYQSLLKSRRQKLHARIAALLAGPETPPEILARHYAEAGLVVEAAEAWGRAGHAALIRSAMREACVAFRSALDLLRQQPFTSERQRRELDLLAPLSVALINVTGPGSNDVEAVQREAASLAAALGDRDGEFRATWLLWRVHTVRGELDESVAVSQRLFEAARIEADRDHELHARHAQWSSRLFRGDLQTTVCHVEHALKLYDPGRHAASAMVLGGHDAKECGLTNGGNALFLLGYPERARAWNSEGLAHALELGHPQIIVHALNWNVILPQLLDDLESIQDRLDMAAPLIEEHGLAMYYAEARILKAWLTVRFDADRKAAETMRTHLDRRAAMGTSFVQTYFFALIADAWLRLGEPAEALLAVEEGRLRAERMGEHFFAAELLRLAGASRLALDAGDAGAAEADLLAALEDARGRHARLWELRAARDLARLWAEQGEREKAHDLLAPVYGWFTEGFDTADLKDAKALLGELA